MTDWRQRLREVIKRKGFKQYLVAEDAGIASVTLTRILTNPASDPRLSTIVRVARAIDEPVSALLDEPLIKAADSGELQTAIGILQRVLARSSGAE